MFKINKTYFELMFIFKECLNCWSCSDRKYAGGDVYLWFVFFWGRMFLVFIFCFCVWFCLTGAAAGETVW